MRINHTFLLVSLLSISSITGATDTKGIELDGFDCADKSVHMIEWLGRGTNYSDFVLADVKEELMRQQPGSQLLKLECTDEPEFLTSALPKNENESEAILSKFSVTFPLKATVNLSGTRWELRIDQNYLAENLNIPNGRKVTQSFTVTGSAKK